MFSIINSMFSTTIITITPRILPRILHIGARYTSTSPPPSNPIADSNLLATTRHSALTTPAITWLDDASSSAFPSGRETRKINTYQAIRDAIRSVPTPQPLHVHPPRLASHWPRTTMLWSLERMLLSVVSSGAPWSELHLC